MINVYLKLNKICSSLNFFKNFDIISKHESLAVCKRWNVINVDLKKQWTQDWSLRDSIIYGWPIRKNTIKHNFLAMIYQKKLNPI